MKIKYDHLEDKREALDEERENDFLEKEVIDPESDPCNDLGELMDPFGVDY